MTGVWKAVIALGFKLYHSRLDSLYGRRIPKACRINR